MDGVDSGMQTVRQMAAGLQSVRGCLARDLDAAERRALEGLPPSLARAIRASDRGIAGKSAAALIALVRLEALSHLLFLDSVPTGDDLRLLFKAALACGLIGATELSADAAAAFLVDRSMRGQRPRLPA